MTLRHVTRGLGLFGLIFVLHLWCELPEPRERPYGK